MEPLYILTDNFSTLDFNFVKVAYRDHDKISLYLVNGIISNYNDKCSGKVYAGNNDNPLNAKAFLYTALPPSTNIIFPPEKQTTSLSHYLRLLWKHINRMLK